MPAPASSSPLFHRGYFSGDGYTYNAFSEYFPLRLSLIALLAGQRPPRLDHPFRLVEMGCGQGVGLCLQAALHPQGQFSGIDVLPSHISHGRQLAASAGLTNIDFQEADLIALAGLASPAGAAGQATAQSAPAACSTDLVICHGVLSWVSREVQQAIWQLASAWLRPGGLLAISYNAFPGKLSAVPFQHLVRSLQDGHLAGSASLEAAIQLSQRLQASGAGIFQSQPGLASLLDGLADSDPTYLPHEYNQRHWQPRFSDDVIRQAGEHGLSFLASTSLAEAFEGLLPPNFRELLAEQQDPGLRQLLRDLLTNASFRRDVYVRGHDQLWPLEAQQALGEITILRQVSASQLERSDPEGLYDFPLSFGVVQGNPDWFGSFLRALGPEPRRIRDLQPLEGVEPLRLRELLQNVALLLEKGLVALLAPPVDPAPAQRLNRVLAAGIRAGAPYRQLAAPLTGSVVAISDLDGLLLAAYLDGRRSLDLVASLDADLLALGRDLLHDGVSLSGDRRQAFLRHQVDRFLRHRLPTLQRLGAVPGEPG